MTDQCQGKRTFRTRKVALQYMRRVQSRPGGAQVRRAYQCPLCNWWHLTSQPPRKD